MAPHYKSNDALKRNPKVHTGNFSKEGLVAFSFIISIQLLLIHSSNVEKKRELRAERVALKVTANMESMDDGNFVKKAI